MIKHLVACGDSFMFGSDLVELESRLREQLSDLTDKELQGVQFINTYEHYDRYHELLNSVRFSALLADKFDLQLHDFSMGGASLMGIKGQVYTALSTLREQGIMPNECLYLIGLTSPLRKMSGRHHFSGSLTLIKDTKRFPGKANFWRRLVSNSVVPNLKRNTPAVLKYFEAITDPEITPPGINQLEISFTAADFASIMKSSGAQYCLMNIWGRVDTYMIRHPDFEDYIDNIYEAVGLDTIYPSYDCSFEEYLQRRYNNTSYRYPDAHFNVFGHKVIADFMEPVIIKKLKNLKHVSD